jgi:hypothetical protein
VASLERQIRREIKANRKLARAETRAVRRALRLQAKEYERRLTDLNHENDRVRQIQADTLSGDKFEDYKTTQETALKLALDRQDDRIKALENWKARATGIGIVLVLFAGAVGAAIMRALTG